MSRALPSWLLVALLALAGLSGGVAASPGEGSVEGASTSRALAAGDPVDDREAVDGDPSSRSHAPWEACEESESSESEDESAPTSAAVPFGARATVAPCSLRVRAAGPEHRLERPAARPGASRGPPVDAR